MKLNYLRIGMVVLMGFSGSIAATEYIYRDLMANTIPSVKCESLDNAQTTAIKPYKVKRYSKKFCQTQGYGWHLDSVKDKGKVVCNECSDKVALQQCYLQDVVVKCKRIKPGSVGMLPGKS